MIPAIDIHGHIGDAGGFPQREKEKEFFSIPLLKLEKMMLDAGVKALLASPAEGIFPYGKHTICSANEEMSTLAERFSWLYQWVIIHPEIPETYRQAEVMLKRENCVGIKIHPDAHQYPISDYGDEIFAFADRFGAVVQTHTGGAFSLPEDFVEYANRYPQVNVLLSHLGNSGDGDVEHQIRAVLKSRHGNLYTDVSSVKSILPHLIEWAVREVGSKKILFGTDTPLHHIGMMRSRIDYADITQEEKEDIFYKNAVRVVGDKLSQNLD